MAPALSYDVVEITLFASHHQYMQYEIQDKIKLTTINSMYLKTSNYLYLCISIKVTVIRGINAKIKRFVLVYVRERLYKVLNFTEIGD